MTDVILISLFVIAILFLLLLLIGGITAPDRCALTIQEILSFWKDYCQAPIIFP